MNRIKERQMFVKITITQVNWDGQGNDRVFHRYVRRENLDIILHSIERAFNMTSTRVEVKRRAALPDPEHRRSER